MNYEFVDTQDRRQGLEIIYSSDNYDLLMGYRPDGNFQLYETYNNSHLAIEEPDEYREIGWDVWITITKKEIDSVNKEESSQHVHPIFDSTIERFKDLIEFKYKDTSFYSSGYPVERQMQSYSIDLDTDATFASRDFEQELQAAGVGYLKSFSYIHRGLDTLSNLNK